MLSIIICSISDERLEALKRNIESTVGIEYEIISIDNNVNQWPIAKAYNYGAQSAKYPYLFFVHEDIMFHSIGWGEFIIDKLAEPDCGVIGFIGSKVKLKAYSGWGQNPKWICAYLYQRGRDKTYFNVHNAYLNTPFEEVVALDGLGLFVKKEIWKSFPFDEKLLTGFHCYDLDFSLQIAASKKYKNYVCCSNQVLIEHFSLGNINQDWFIDTIRLHREKWNQILPMKTDDCILDDKFKDKEEERFFNIFLRAILKSSCSESKMIFKEFLQYRFSWKHFFHCISGLYYFYFKR